MLKADFLQSPEEVKGRVESGLALHKGDCLCTSEVLCWYPEGPAATCIHPSVSPTISFYNRGNKITNNPILNKRVLVRTVTQAEAQAAATGPQKSQQLRPCHICRISAISILSKTNKLVRFPRLPLKVGKRGHDKV